MGQIHSGFLVTCSETLAKGVIDALPEFLADMSAERQAYALAVLSGMNGGIVLAENEQQAYDFINEYAPEHCQILARGGQASALYPNRIRNIAGRICSWLAGKLYDGAKLYCPTSGAAHAHAPLGVHDFVRTASIGRMDANGFAEMAPKTEIFARYEGFDAHANAVSPRRLPLIRGRQEDQIGRQPFFKKPSKAWGGLYGRHLFLLSLPHSGAVKPL